MLKSISKSFVTIKQKQLWNVKIVQSLRLHVENVE